MCYVAIYPLIILPIDNNALIKDLRRTVLGHKFLCGLVKVILNTIWPWDIPPTDIGYRIS